MKVRLNFWPATITALGMSMAAWAQTSPTITINAIAGGPVARGYLPLATNDVYIPETSNLPSFLKVSEGYGPSSAFVQVDPSALAPNTYTIPIVFDLLMPGTGAPDGTLSATVIVKVASAAPQLQIAPNPILLTSTGLEASPNPSITVPVVVQNVGGGGAQPVSVTIVDNPAPAWLSVQTIAQRTGEGAAFTVTANPSAPIGGLQAGVYYATIRVTSGTLTQDIPVIYLKRTSLLYFNLSKQALYFTAQAGQGTPLTQTVSVLDASTALNYKATADSDFVTITNGSGTVSPPSPGVITVGVTPKPAGTYYSIVTVTPSQTFNEIAPVQFVVVYNVTASATVDVQPAGLIFVAKPNATPPTMNVNLIASTSTPIPFTVGTNSTNFELTTKAGTISGTGTTSVPINLDPSPNPGFYRGTVQINLGAPLNTTRLVDVLLIVVPTSATITAAASTEALPRATTNCTASSIAIIGTTLAGNFTQPAGWPASFSTRVLDNCANPVTNANVSVAFSNGDPALAARLESSSTGTYAATWTPNHPGTVTVTARAVAGNLSASTSTDGTVPANTSVPIVAPNGTLHNLNSKIGAPLAPGTIAAIYGTGLSSGTGSPGQVPLPNTFQATSVLIGGESAPFYYASDGQLNVELPTDLPPNEQYTLIVSNGGKISVPQMVTITDVAPGVAAFADGTIIAQHLDYTLVDASHPAKPGETLIMYLAGMGATNPAVPTGTAAPATEPLARVANQPTVTVGGATAQVIFAGLTPNSVGLYQIDFTVPASASAGNLKVVVTQNGQVSNTTTLPVVSQ